MPFDGISNPKQNTKYDNLRKLSAWLKQPMPEGFEWDYGDWQKCAIGLYMHKTGKTLSLINPKLFGIKGSEYMDLFRCETMAYDKIKPRTVARWIDALLEQKEAA